MTPMTLDGGANDAHVFLTFRADIRGGRLRRRCAARWAASGACGAVGRGNGTRPERAGAVETVKLLIDCGANIVQDDVLLRDAYGDTTLHLAAMACNVSGPGIMKVLLDTIAATHPDKVKELISENCENFCNTPLHWVVLGGNYEVAKHMVSLGARAPPQFSTTRLSAPLALAQRDAQPLIPPMAPIAQGWARRTRRS